MTPPQIFIPESAPFNEAQRLWLNGFIAGLLGAERALAAGATIADGSAVAAAASQSQAEDTPWHDPTLALDERMRLATGRPLVQRMMAAMGQLDCGQCGYQCDSYAAAIASGGENDIGKCVPGGRETARALKLMIVERATAPATAAPARAAPVERGYGRDAPVAVKFVSSVALNAADSDKDTRHVVLDLAGSGLQYSPGDSLGIWPQNNPDEIELILAILKARGSEAVTLADGGVITAREALTRECNLREPGPALYALLAAEAGDVADRTRLATLAADDANADALGVHDVLDALMEFRSARPRVVEFVAALERLQPRMYSIASSQSAHPAEVHLTVGLVRYEHFDRAYQGVGSSFLGLHLVPGRPLSAFVQRSHFRLPGDPAAGVIMVGPGTGIAPFRAFLEERAACGATGRNWLFFGNPRRERDFLYRDELEDYASRRILTRMDLAFSRDQASKVYVQHRMLEAADEVWRWIANGAYLYVCGDAKRMAGDVDLALRQIAVEQGGMDVAAAKRYVAELARAGRYQRDVY